MQGENENEADPNREPFELVEMTEEVTAQTIEPQQSEPKEG